MKKQGFWYGVLQKSSDFCGPWLFVVVSWTIATGFFFLSFFGRVQESRRFYAALYPDQGRLYHLWCTFKQYQNFTTIHFDRFLSTRKTPVTFTSEGREKLEAVIGSQGGILLMSHLGNWELAAHLLKQQKKDLQMLLYMGIKEKEGIERMQKEELRRAGVKIIGVEQDGGSPFSAVEGIRFLKKGGLVSMTGDMVWQQQQRTAAASFLGHEIRLPEAPYVFALVSGAPIFSFFAFRTGNNRYHITLEGPIFIPPHNRKNRHEAISLAARQYAKLLENALREHPCQWYHFDRFLGDPANKIF